MIYKHISLVFALSFLILSCTQRIYQVDNLDLNNGLYDSGFPYQDCSQQLKEIINSVKQINCMATYESYLFPQEEGVTSADIHQQIVQYDKKPTYDHHPVSGTATIISKTLKKVLILTCAHIIDFPDTIYAYYQKENGESEFLQSVAILSKLEIYINDIPNGNNIEVLVIDSKNDIALLGVDIDRTDKLVPVFGYPIGSSRELEWGSFVYILGYPVGNKMITRGIVSKSDMAASSTFLIDALFNRGFSGGLVLAVRDGVPNFELVGIAKSVSAEINYVLVPDKKPHEYSYNPQLPYAGSPKVALKEEINYGITYAISIETIGNLITSNKKLLENKGFSIDRFLTHK